MQTINFDYLQLQANDRILDLGCGEGRHALTAFMLEDIESVGVDLNLSDLKTVRTRFEEFKTPNTKNRSLQLSVADGKNLPFENETFDKVICSEVLEHVPNYRDVLGEIVRVLKTGGVFAASVPRFFPEWLCWQLSDAYREVEGGHIRIFNARRLRDDIEKLGLVFFKRHYAHSLHAPYWWLRCLFWRPEDQQQTPIVKAYQRFLEWDLMEKPKITTLLDTALNPVVGKSVVMYFVKTPTAIKALDSSNSRTEPL